MAGVESIETARDALEESVYGLVTLVEAFREMGDAAGGPLSSAKWPAWFFVMQAHATAIDARTQAFVQAVHQHARPLVVSCPCGACFPHPQ